MRQWESEWWCLRRSTEQELLDAPDVSVRDVRGNLDDLRHLNRLLGSRLIVVAALHRLWRRAGCPSDWRVLDIGTGGGDIPLALCGWSHRRGVRLQIIGIDKHQRVIRQAQCQWRPHATLTLMLADALRLPFRPRSFDVVLCSTMLHHLSYDEGIVLLRSMAQVARHGFVVNDLIRGRLHYIGARLLMPLLARNRLTLHDGPLSVRRAYRIEEIRHMAAAAGLVDIRLRTVLGYRALLVYTRGSQEDHP
jgi:2-polyprenyl-3-methyl-5-hydroxy-6-metoxy-1,4-benzoquinol methylase